MEIGDRIFCKKSKLNFTKNKMYEIVEISGTPEMPMYFIENDLVGIVQSPRNFLFGDTISLYPELEQDLGKKANSEENEHYIWNYFYRPQELRKLKLEKLNKYGT